MEYYNKVIESVQVRFLKGSNYKIEKPITVLNYQENENALILLHHGSLKFGEEQELVNEGEVIFLSKDRKTSLTFGAKSTKQEVGMEQFAETKKKHLQSISYKDIKSSEEDCISILQFESKVFDVVNFFNSLDIPPFIIRFNDRIATLVEDVMKELETTGVGKERFARALHEHSDRATGPFVAVNCAALPAELIEAELFGVEKGAYTGAHAARAGRFERAEGGTLFLDEVGDLPLAAQAKLLRVLQEGEIERLGAEATRKVNVRMVTATNVDLEAAVAQGRFRRDLLYRLNVYPICIPPLRERSADIEPLARHLLARFMALHNKRLSGLGDRALQALMRHDWPGNVRELENCLQRALILRNGLYIQAQDLGLSVPVSSTPEQAPRLQPQALEGGKAALRASGKWAEYQHVIDTIRRFGGHKTKAAESLGMTPRALRYRLNAMREQGVQIPV